MDGWQRWEKDKSDKARYHEHQSRIWQCTWAFGHCGLETAAMKQECVKLVSTPCITRTLGN